MNIEQRGNGLSVRSSIFFDDDVFCGSTYVSLIAFKDKADYGWNCYSIGVTVHDQDDFDIGLIYQTDAERFDTVLRELINWMHDHEQGGSSYEKLISSPGDFFPDCGCKRIRW